MAKNERGTNSSSDVSPEALGPQIIAALRLMESDLEAGSLITIEADRTRVHLLPLHGEE
jgi:hypothetical protein